MGIFSAGSASVQIIPDFRGAEASIKSFFAGQGDIKVKVTPDLANGDVARTEAELNAMHGTATVTVDKKALSDSIATGMHDALSASGLDKLSSVVNAAIGPSLVATAVGALTELASVAGSALGVVALLPAALLALAAPAAVVALGVKGVGAAFKALDSGNLQQIQAAMAKLAPSAQDFVKQVFALKPAFDGLRLDVQQTLFEGMGTAVTSLAKVALPILQTGLHSVAADLNSGLLATMGTLKNDAPQFVTIFTNISTAGRSLSGAMAPLVDAFVRLGAVGSQFLPEIAAGLLKAAQAADQWVQKAQQTGQLTNIIQGALSAIEQLGRLLINVGSIVEGILAAALPFGRELLGLLDQVTGQLAVFVHSTQGQTALASFFGAINQAISILLPVIGQLVQVILANVLPGLGSLAAALAPVIALLGTQLVTVIKAVSGFIPPLSKVIADLVNAFAPLIPQIGAIITTLLPPLLTLFEQLAPVIGQFTSIVADILLKAVQLLTPALVPVGSALVQILAAVVPLIPPLSNLALQLFPPLVDLLKALAPIAVSAAKVLADIAGVFLQIAGATVLPLVVFLISNLAAGLKVLSPILGPMAGVILAIVGAVKLWTLAQGLLDIALDANPIGLLVVAIGALVVAIGFLVTHLDTVKAVFADVIGFLGTSLSAFVSFWENSWNVVSSFFQTIWNGISSFFRGLFTALVAWAVQQLTGFTAFWQATWNGVSSFFQTIWNDISSFFRGLFTALIAWVVQQLNAYVAFWQATWNGVSSFFQTIWNGISSFFRGLFTALVAWLVQQLNAFVSFWQGVWQGISQFFSDRWNDITNSAKALWNGISGFFVGALNGFVGFWQGIWNNVSGAFQTVWNGIKGFAQQVWNGILDIIKAPIKFVVVTILDNGLFKAWDAVNDFLGLPWHINPLGPGLGFEEGGFTGQGIFGTGRTDDPAGVVHAGEFVHTQEKTRQWLPIFQMIHQGLLQPGDLGVPGFAAGGLANTPQSQWTWPELNQIRQQMFPGSVLTDAYRPGANDYHGAGQAIDIGWPGNDPTHLAAIALALGHAFPGMTEGIHNPNLSIKNGQQVPASFWGAATWAAHANHVHWAETPQALGAGNPTPGGGSLVTIAGQVINNIGDILNQLTGSIGGPVNQLLGQFGQSHWVQILAALPQKLLSGLWGKASGAVGSALATIQSAAATAAGIGGGTPSQVNTSGIKAEAFQIAGQQFGWNAVQQQQGLDYIATHESNWNPKAQNPVSTASGTWQMINSTWNAYKNAGPWPTAKDAPSGEQDVAAFRYIRSAYGDPVAAQQHWAVAHSYDTGGFLPPGYTTVFNGTGGFEAVLNGAQQDSITNALSGQNGAPVWHFYLGSQEITDLVDTRVTFHNARDGRTIRSSR